MHKLRINSSIRPYGLEITYNFKENLKKVYSKGDLLLIDSAIYNKYTLPKIIDKYYIIKIKPNESKKEYLYITNIISNLLKKEFSKKNKIICIGGGILQDITSFISSILFRGVNWYFFPTTLLAQADSCIGGKISINFKNYKNQIGNYYPPNYIYIDLNFLTTLNKDQIYSGVGEIMHYYLVSNKKDFLMIKKNLDLLLSGDLKTLSKTIIRSLEIKKKFIEKDEFDKNYRLLLNYGHTFGHALESITNFNLPHGIAVAHGMNMANYFSYKYGYLSKNKFEDMESMLSKVYCFTLPKKFKQKNYENILLKDKKSINGTLRLVLSKNPGKMFLKKIKLNNQFKKILKDYFIKYYNF